MIRTFGLFAGAAVLEIAGCFAFWMWLRRGAPPAILVVGVAALVGFAMLLAKSDAAFAGRAYAAYGGIYIVASLLWLWVLEGQRPTPLDLAGAALCVAGATLIASSFMKS